MSNTNEMKQTIKELKEMVAKLSLDVSQLKAASICCCPSMLNCKIHRKKYDPMACHRSMAADARASESKVQRLDPVNYDSVVFGDEPKKDFTKRDRRVNAHRKPKNPAPVAEPVAEPEPEPLVQMVEEYKSTEPSQEPGKKFKKPTKRPKKTPVIGRSIYTPEPNSYRPISPVYTSSQFSPVYHAAPASPVYTPQDESDVMTIISLLQTNEPEVKVAEPEVKIAETSVLEVLNNPIIKDMARASRTTSIVSDKSDISESLILNVLDNPEITDMTKRVFNDTHYSATKHMFAELSLITSKKTLNKFRIKNGVAPLLTNTLEEQRDELKFALAIHMGVVDEQRLKLFSLKALREFATDTDLSFPKSATKQKLIKLIIKEYQ